MLAGAITVVLDPTNFPNGGPGFFGYNDNFPSPPIRRPVIAARDPAFFRYSVVVAAVMFVLVLSHIRAPAGAGLGGDPPERARGADGRRQRQALQDVGVRAGLVHHRRRRRPARLELSTSSTSIEFPTSTRYRCLAVVLMGGVYTLWGADRGRAAVG